MKLQDLLNFLENAKLSSQHITSFMNGLHEVNKICSLHIISCHI